MLAQKLTLALMQTQWAQELNPIIANPLVQGQLLSNISLVSGNNVVNHKLGRNIIGWFLVSPQSGASVFQAAVQPLPNLQLTLVSNASIVTQLWVF